jgi:hypothetical protein
LSIVTLTAADSRLEFDIGPPTNIGTFLEAILSAVSTPNHGTSNPRVTLQKQRLLNCPTILETDTLDTIKMVE